MYIVLHKCKCKCKLYCFFKFLMSSKIEICPVSSQKNSNLPQHTIKI